MRYVMWIAEFCESSRSWTQLAVPQSTIPVGVSLITTLSERLLFAFLLRGHARVKKKKKLTRGKCIDSSRLRKCVRKKRCNVFKSYFRGTICSSCSSFGMTQSSILRNNEKHILFPSSKNKSFFAIVQLAREVWSTTKRRSKFFPLFFFKKKRGGEKTFSMQRPPIRQDNPLNLSI